MRILLIVCGSVAAYKSLELVRELQRNIQGCEINVVVTKGASQFVTPLAFSSLTGRNTYSDLFSLTDEVEMGHIALARHADMIVVAPASADFMAKAAHGAADDLASTVLLARDPTRTSLIIAPAMNPTMWQHPAVQRNVVQLQRDGATIIAPEAGEAACGEVGVGRLASLERIVTACMQPPAHHFSLPLNLTLSDKHFIVTAGATHEPLDPVRFVGNYSSGKQGIAIALALKAAGARVTLVHGHITAPLPAGIHALYAPTAAEMLHAVEGALPVDGLICAAAVADWQPSVTPTEKMKKQGDAPLTLTFIPTPDILATIANHPTLRPRLVIGFAAETNNLLAHAKAKLTRKGCDWIVANDVSGGAIFGQDETDITLITADATFPFGRISKYAAAEHLIIKIMEYFHGSLHR